MKHFSIPGYWTHFFEIQALMQYYNSHKDYFYPDRVMDSFYDLRPGLLWGGGRVSLNKNSFLTIEEVMDYFQSLPGVDLCHVCTNEVLDETMVQNEQCNEFIRKYYRPNDYIIFNSEILHNYLKPYIPANKFVYSATIGLKDIDLVNEYSKNNIVVINYAYNNDDEYIRSLSNPQNIEVICAELCIDNCPNQFNHYRAYSKINAKIPLDENESIFCKFKDNVSDTPIEKYNKYFTFQHCITNERVDQLADLGVNIFKISGRERSTELFFLFICYYLVLPEYREQVYKDLIVLTNKTQLKYSLNRRSKR